MRDARKNVAPADRVAGDGRGDTIADAMTRCAMILMLCLLMPPAASAEPVRVAAAVSLNEAVTEVAEAYQKDGRGNVTVSFGSSGQLQAQIEYGAPVDVFISAAHKQIDELAKAGRVDGKTKRIVASNRLVLIVPAGAKTPPKNLGEVADPRVRRVAVGEPRTVPAGQYAMQALENLGLNDALKGRLVHGANVRQVLDYVERGEVDAGIVYATDAREAGGGVRVVETVDPKCYDAIEYPAVLISDSRRREAARDFLDYLATPRARDILARRGFTVAPDEKPAPAPPSGT
jgi:molybdate transport system substrate-binding protein